MVVMVDASQLVKPDQFSTQKSFVAELLDRFTVSNDDIHAGLVFFGFSSPGVPMLSGNGTDIKKNLADATQGTGSQNLDKGLEAARTSFASSNYRSDALKTLTVLLQGKPESAEKALKQTKLLKEEGVRVIFTVVDREGGCPLNKHILEQLASEPASENLFFFKSFEELHGKVGQQAANLCPSLNGDDDLPSQYLPTP
jgi:hypothetical protein